MDKLNGTRQGRHIRINSPLSCFTRLGLVSFGWGDVDLRRPPSVICLMFLHFSMACLTRTTTRPAPADADPIYLRQWNKNSQTFFSPLSIFSPALFQLTAPMAAVLMRLVCCARPPPVKAPNMFVLMWTWPNSFFFSAASCLMKQMLALGHWVNGITRQFSF